MSDVIPQCRLNGCQVWDAPGTETLNARLNSITRTGNFIIQLFKSNNRHKLSKFDLFGNILNQY